MKKLLLLLVLPLVAINVNAQKIKIDVNEKSEKIGDGSHNAMVVIIYDATKDDIEKEWKSKMKDYNAKVSTKGDIFADNALIKEISDNTVDVYARVEKGSNDNEWKFIVGFQMGEDWLSSSKYPAQYKAAEKIVKDFATKMTKDAMGDKVKTAEKALNKVKDEKSDLEKKNKDLHDDISNYQDKIKKAEDDIKSNEDEQKKKQAEVDAQQKVLDDLKARQNSVE